MPEVIRFPIENLGPFAAGRGKGIVYTPPPNKVEDADLYAHTVQTILAEPQALYEFWKDAHAKPRWMEFVISVEPHETFRRWTFGDPDEPDGKRVVYDLRLAADEPGKKVAWESVTEDVVDTGEVTFEPASNGRGTLVTLKQRLKVPGGAAGHAFAALAKRSPKQIIIENLRHFKQLAESGEIPSVVGQPNGPRGFSGSLKAHLYGENNPTPKGTSES